MLFYLAVLAVFGGALADLKEYPQNVAVVSGDTVILKCAASLPNPQSRIIWTEFATSSLGRDVSDNRGILGSHPNSPRYSIEGDSSNNEFYLRIENVKTEDAGEYLCQDVNNGSSSVFRRYAELIVFESKQVCTPLRDQSSLVEGESYTTHCQVNFITKSITPVMEWGGNANKQSNKTASTSSLSSYMTFTAQRSLEGETFQCFTYFRPVTPASPLHADNRPTYVDTYVLPVHNISHELEGLKEYPQNLAVVSGDTVVLKCAANRASPHSRIVWTEFATTSFGRNISDDRGILSSHPNSPRYSIEGDASNNEFYLRIENVKPEDAGEYLCQDINSGSPSVFSRYAELIVFESKQVCTPLKDQSALVEGESYTTHCRVNFITKSITPVMEWGGVSGTFQTNKTASISNLSSYMTFTAQKSLEGETFQCFAYFRPVTPASPSHADNRPTYVDTYVLPVGNVSNEPPNVTLTTILGSTTVTTTSPPSSDSMFHSMSFVGGILLGVAVCVLALLGYKLLSAAKRRKAPKYQEPFKDANSVNADI